MTINKHGYKMTGLRKASGETRSYPDSGSYDEIFYDRKTGEIWTRYQCSLGQNSWTQYDSPDIVKVCNTDRHMTMQEIADRIAQTMTDIE